MKTKLLKEKEILEHLNISRTSFWRLKKEGLPIVKVGNANRYNVDDVMTWISNEPQTEYKINLQSEPNKQKDEKKNERIINTYEIDINYLLKHNQIYLQKYLSKTERQLLEKRLSLYDDKNLSNQEIVRFFSNEYEKIIKENYQEKTKPEKFNEKLNNFIDKNDNSIRVVWGDCYETLQQMNSESISLMVTSPPYYNARKYSTWDNLNLYLDDMRKIIRESFRVLENHRVWVWNVGDIFDNDKLTSKATWGKRRLPLGAYFIKIFEEEGFEFIDDLIWNKGEVESKRQQNNGKDYPLYQYPINCYEHILIFHKHRLDKNKYPCPVCGSLNVNGNSQSGIGVQSWECKNEKCFVRSPKNRGKRFSLRTNMMQYKYEENKKNTIDKLTIKKWRKDIIKFSPVIKINSKGKNTLGHTAPFPDEIPEMAVKYFSYIGEKVLDPFAGSFTTPIVAKNLERIGIGIELNKTMFEDAIINKINSNSSLFTNTGNKYTEFEINPI